MAQGLAISSGTSPVVGKDIRETLGLLAEDPPEARNSQMLCRSRVCFSNTLHDRSRPQQESRSVQGTLQPTDAINSVPLELCSYHKWKDSHVANGMLEF